MPDEDTEGTEVTEEVKEQGADAEAEGESTEAVDEGEIETPADDAPAEVEVEGEPEELVAKATPATKSRFQERINEVTAARRVAERRAFELEERNVALRAELAKLKPPVPEDFEDYALFVRAAAKYEAKAEKLELGNQAVQSEVQASQQAYQDFQITRYQEAAEEHTGFAVKAKQIGDILTPQTEAYHALFEADNFGDLVMSMTVEDARRISALSPRAQHKEILKLETQLEAGILKLAAVKKVSKAPAPAAKVASGKTERARPNPDKMSMNDYAAMRQAQIKKARER